MTVAYVRIHGSLRALTTIEEVTPHQIDGTLELTIRLVSHPSPTCLVGDAAHAFADDFRGHTGHDLARMVGLDRPRALRDDPAPPAARPAICPDCWRALGPGPDPVCIGCLADAYHRWDAEGEHAAARALGELVDDALDLAPRSLASIAASHGESPTHA